MSNDPALAGDSGAGNGEESTAGASGESGAGGEHATDSTTECERLSNVQCQQFYTCATPADLAQFTSLVGTNESDCVALFNAANCVNTACPAGETYMPANADDCVKRFAALSCTTFIAIANQAAANPASCNSICE